MLQPDIESRICSYFYLKEKIKKKRFQFQRVRKHLYYGKTLTTRTQETQEGLSLITVGFRVEDEVLDMLLAQEEMKYTEGLLMRKQRYFDQFMNRLDPLEQKYLYQRFKKKDHTIINEELDQQAADEVDEIETAINYIYGFPKEEERTEGLSIAEVCERIGI
ncbi:hypothetical protein [Alkalicoccus urumqiensis]|uniref:Uncharacterized protein n=1 Tax=Alkalicoccus urumqiensis TaxID=1548213 RepID=A0A2P6ME56_ALKUR|nr:hypothetical protein [Alkalicoccus urumqiensis]PRO64562.1 hypothetical protein C6I21_13770 [Alkalicoccus urumqiensis]